MNIRLTLFVSGALDMLIGIMVSAWTCTFIGSRIGWGGIDRLRRRLNKLGTFLLSSSLPFSSSLRGYSCRYPNLTAFIFCLVILKTTLRHITLGATLLELWSQQPEPPILAAERVARGDQSSSRWIWTGMYYRLLPHVSSTALLRLVSEYNELTISTTTIISIFDTRR